MALHRELLTLLDVIFAETNPGPMKAVYDMIGIDAPLLLSPLVEVARPLVAELKDSWYSSAPNMRCNIAYRPYGDYLREPDERICILWRRIRSMQQYRVRTLMPFALCSHGSAQSHYINSQSQTFHRHTWRENPCCPLKVLHNRLSYIDQGCSLRFEQHAVIARRAICVVARDDPIKKAA